MFQSMRKNTALIFLAISFLAVASYCQLQIPSLIADGLLNVVSGDYNAVYLSTFGIFFIGKSFAFSLGNSLASYIESDTRFYLIKLILSNETPRPLELRLTLIKEDAERVASAISELIQLSGSCLLSSFTAYILIRENTYFFIPIIVITILTIKHVRSATTKIQTTYEAEINKEEIYKSSVIHLFTQSHTNSRVADIRLSENHKFLSEATYARYQYNKTTLLLGFWPEAIIALCTVLVIILAVNFSTELFGVQLIAYLGYIGLFSMASSNSVKISLSLIGVDISVKRIFEGSK